LAALTLKVTYLAILLIKNHFSVLSTVSLYSLSLK